MPRRETKPRKIVRLSGFDEYVGRQLKVRRQQLELTQSDLAKKLGVTPQQIQKYETGVTRLSAGTIFLAAAMLSVPVTFFVAGLRIGGQLQEY